MYLVGSSDLHRSAAGRLLERSVDKGEHLVTDAEVFQEILHRYVAIRRHEAIQPAFDALRRVVDEIFPIEEGDIERAKEIVLGSRRLSARDALHLAAMEARGITKIMSFDAGVDGYPGIQRIGP